MLTPLTCIQIFGVNKQLDTGSIQNPYLGRRQQAAWIGPHRCSPDPPSTDQSEQCQDIINTFRQCCQIRSD